MSFFFAIVPLVCAAGFLALSGAAHAADPASGAVVAASVLAFAYLAKSATSRNLGEQIGDAARRLRDEMAAADALRKTIDRSTISQQNAAEKVDQARERTQVLVDELRKAQSEVTTSVEKVLAERDRAHASAQVAAEELLEAHSTVWRLAAESGGHELLAQAARQFEVRHLRQLGVSPIVDTGVAVNDDQHDVEAEAPTAEGGVNTVVRVLRPGYMRGGQVIRRAKVVRGRPHEAPPPAAPAADALAAAPGEDGGEE